MNKFKVMLVLLFSVSLIACSNQLPSKSVIHSEQTGPVDHSIGSRLVKIADRTETLDDLWGEFNLEGKAPTINFDESTILFLHTIESSCPKRVKKMEWNEDESILTLHTTTQSDNCNDIGIPRTFVLELEEVKVRKLDTVVFEGEPFNIGER